MSINKVLLAPSHAYVLVYCYGWFDIPMANLNNYHRDRNNPQGQKYLPPGPLCKKFTNP